MILYIQNTAPHTAPYYSIQDYEKIQWGYMWYEAVDDCIRQSYDENTDNCIHPSDYGFHVHRTQCHMISYMGIYGKQCLQGI
jgi:hypothetical protein